MVNEEGLKLQRQHSHCDNMASELMVCPDCGKGALDSEETEEHPNGDYTEVCYYSCGHSVKSEHLFRNCDMLIPAIKCEAEISKMKTSSEEKVKNKPVNEIENTFKRNDLDNPEKTVILTYCKYRSTNQTWFFQVVKYVHGKVKHIHCKTCENSWEYDSEYPMENKFIFEFISDENIGNVSAYLHGIKIQCLNCNAKYEHQQELQK